MAKKSGVAGLLAVLAVGAFPAVAFADGPFQYHAVTPCRVFDSRIDNGGTVAVPDDMVERGISHLRIQGTCGIPAGVPPAGARAVTINVTVISTQSNGHITLWPDDGSEPVVSTLNFLTGEQALANGAIVPLRANPDTSAACPLEPDAADVHCDLAFRYVRQFGDPGSDAGHIAFDVTGYFQ